MEKIDTPLMMRAKQIKNRIDAIEDEAIVGVTAKRILQMELNDTINLMDKEREIIEKVHSESIIEFVEALGMEAETEPSRAKDYFDRTFKILDHA